MAGFIRGEESNKFENGLGNYYTLTIRSSVCGLGVVNVIINVCCMIITKSVPSVNKY